MSTRSHPNVALQPLHCLAEPEPNAVVPVDALENPAHLGPQCSHHRRIEELDDVDVQSHGSKRGRDLHPDEPGADDDRPASGLRERPDAVGVFEGTKLQHAVQVGCPGTSRIRLRAPVASSSRSYPIDSPPATWTPTAAGSTASARVPRPEFDLVLPVPGSGCSVKWSSGVSPRR